MMMMYSVSGVTDQSNNKNEGDIGHNNGENNSDDGDDCVSGNADDGDDGIGGNADTNIHLRRSARTKCAA